MTAISLPTPTRQAAQREAEAILSDISGVTAVVIATTDGFDVASALLRQIDPARIAALASSIAAIGEVVSSEAKLGTSRCVTVETDAGFAVAQRVPRSDVPMVLKVLAGPDCILAQVKYRIAAAAQALAAA